MSGPKDLPPRELRELATLVRALHKAERRRNWAVVQAFNDRDGYTVNDIAKAAGLSRPRIYQIVKEAEDGND